MKTLILTLVFCISCLSQTLEYPTILPIAKPTTNLYYYTANDVSGTVSIGQIIWNFSSNRLVTTDISLGTNDQPTRRMLYGIDSITDSTVGYTSVLTDVTEDAMTISHLPPGRRHLFAYWTDPAWAARIEFTA